MKQKVSRKRALDTFSRVVVLSCLMKQKITLTLDDKLIEEIKIQGVREKRSVSEITEEMLREYLNRLNSRAKKIK
jgi:metal-responsive CopG/Arc/MetJ family transcriptional regulator